MALVLKDRVQETTTTSGTGTLTLAGAVSGFDTFSASIGNGNVTYYTIFDNTAYTWEVGIGTVGAGTLARTTVLSNSSGTTSPISLAGNIAFVFCTYPAEKSINYDANDVATIGETLGYSDTGIVGSFASTVAGYNQVIVQNKSTATNASSNLNVSNDAGTAGSNYAELGINSSTFTGTGSFNIAGASYVASASTDLTLGTYGAYNVHFVTNSSTTDAMTIFNDGGISLGGFSNPGIANMAASKFVPGYTSVTSAAGTTILTASSNYYQNLVGTTTQTFRLPDATTLLVGTTFIFDNNSTGTLTVVDNASGTVDTIPSGAAGFVYLVNNSTVAGSWNEHSFLPATYDFNATTANFGNATITNAVWNGTTIASGYGGTGLTTFTAANNALYSTSASNLVAGTLPVAAGGTAATTFTANGVLYGNGTSALGVTAAGTTGQVLLANTSGAPTWGSVPSTGAVTSFQTSLSGLTPSTATTGAVTLAGTLGVTSGGTGSSTAFTTGSVVFAGASGTYTQDNANLFWDDTNNYLGIGTSSPSNILQIYNSTSTTPLVQGDATTTLTLNRNSTDTTGANFIVRKARGTTASPVAVASGDQLGAMQFQAYGGTNNRSLVTIRGYVDTYTSDTDISSYLIFATTPSGSTTATERMRITSAGNIGIGTIAPTTKLTISANTALPSAGAITGTNLWMVGADATSNNLTIDGFAGIPGINGRRAAGTAASPTAIASGATLLGIYGYGYGATGYSSAGRARIIFSASEAWTDTAQGSNINFGTNPIGSAGSPIERMRIDDAGNVGINTTSPISRLDVVGSLISARSSGTTSFGNVAATANDYSTSFRSTNLFQNDSATSGTTCGLSNANLGQLYFTNTSAGLIWTNGSTPLVFGTLSAERMRIDSSGNVGIGTTSPTGKLTVTQATAGATPVVFNGVASRYTFDYLGGGNSYFDQASLVFRKFDATDCGSLATGTNTVLNLVSSTGFALLALNTASGNTSYLDFTANSVATSRISSNTSSGMVFHTGSSNTERMRIDTSGNVGIGTSSPISGANVNLTANGCIAVSGSLSADQTSRGIFDYFSNGTRFLSYGPSGTVGSFSWWSNSGGLTPTEKMRIDSSGNVGIGTNSPANTLHVEKSINSNDLVYLNNLGTSAADVLRLNSAATGSGTNVLDVQSGSTTHLVVKGDGGIGMGISSPAGYNSRLVVAGNVTQLSNNAYEPQQIILGASATANASPYFIFRRARGTYTAPTVLSNGDNLGNLLYGGYSGTAYVDTSAISSVVDGTVTSTNVPSALVFSTGVAFSSERMRIHSSGGVSIGNTTDPGLADLSVTGQVSIGTSANPTALLTLAAGTATANTAPIKFTSGTNLTTPEAGTVEYDGTIITASSNTNFKRGTVPLTNYTSGTGTALGTNTEATLAALLPAANDTITLSIGTYFIDTSFIVTRGASTTSATARLNILGTGTAAGNFSGMSLSAPTAGGATANFSFDGVNINVSNVLTAASTTSAGVYQISLQGILKVTTSGTIIPQYNLSANINGAGTVAKVLYLRLQQLDTQSAAASGPAGTGWA